MLAPLLSPIGWVLCKQSRANPKKRNMNLERHAIVSEIEQMAPSTSLLSLGTLPGQMKSDPKKVVTVRELNISHVV